MEIFSSRLTDNLVFGKYPTQDEIELIESLGFNIIVNLCPNDEITWDPYQVSDSAILYSYPIRDRGIPDTKVTKVISFILKQLRRQCKVYIHCRGGHGRSSVLAGLVWMVMTNNDGPTTLKKLYESHQKRKVMKPKFRKLGSPQTRKQKEFILNYKFD